MRVCCTPPVSRLCVVCAAFHDQTRLLCEGWRPRWPPQLVAQNEGTRAHDLKEFSFFFPTLLLSNYNTSHIELLLCFDVSPGLRSVPCTVASYTECILHHVVADACRPCPVCYEVKQTLERYVYPLRLPSAQSSLRRITPSMTIGVQTSKGALCSLPRRAAQGRRGVGIRNYWRGMKTPTAPVRRRPSAVR